MRHKNVSKISRLIYNRIYNNDETMLWTFLYVAITSQGVILWNQYSLRQKIWNKYTPRKPQYPSHDTTGNKRVVIPACAFSSFIVMGMDGSGNMIVHIMTEALITSQNPLFFSANESWVICTIGLAFCDRLWCTAIMPDTKSHGYFTLRSYTCVHIPS